MRAVEDPLLENNLLLQSGADGDSVFVRLWHAQSGEWLESCMPHVWEPEKKKSLSQASASGSAYARRYATMMVLMLAPVDRLDDDQEGAAEHGRREPPPARPLQRTAAVDPQAAVKRRKAAEFGDMVQEQLRRATDPIEISEVWTANISGILRLAVAHSDLHAMLIDELAATLKRSLIGIEDSEVFAIWFQDAAAVLKPVQQYSPTEYAEIVAMRPEEVNA